MFKKRLKLFVVGMIMCLLLSGCNFGNSGAGSNAKDFYDNSHNIYMDISSNICSFDVALLTKDKVKSVEFLTCSGENIDASKINVSINNNSLDCYANVKTNGLYCSDWLIDIIFEEEKEYSIKNITLKVDGVERVLEFEEPLKYRNEGGNDIINEELYSTVFPCEFSSSMIGTDELIQYEFVADKECEFKGMKATAYFDLGEITYLVNDVEVQQELPISLKKGDRLYAQVKFNKADEKVNTLTYVLTNLEVTYEIDGKDVVRKGPIIFNPISPMDEKNEKLDSFISYILNK